MSAATGLCPDERGALCRLRRTVDDVSTSGQRTFDDAAESWLRDEAAAADDALKADPVGRFRPISAPEFEAKWRRRSDQDRASPAAALRAAGEKFDDRLQLSEVELDAAIEDFERLRKSGH